MTKITEADFEGALVDMLSENENEFPGVELNTVRTFEDAGIMTYNKGLVVSFTDGSEFQITIVRSN